MRIAKLFCVRGGQVNLMVYGPGQPYFKPKQKIILQNFGQLAFYFLLFEKIKNKLI